jgi:MFS family permease
LASSLNEQPERISRPKSLKQHLYYGWVIVAACLAINLVSVGIRHSFGVFFRPLETDFGLSRAFTSGFYSTYLVMCGLISIIGGWMLDRYGPKKVFTGAGILAGLSLLLTSQATAPWHVFVTYSLLLAMGTGPNFVIIMALVSKWFMEEKRGLALGIVSCGAGIGMVAMPPISEFFISSYSWQTSYFILGLLTLFIIIPSALFLRRSPVEMPPDLRKPAATMPQTDAADSYHNSKHPPLVKAIKSSNFWMLFIIMFLWAFCSFIIMAHIVRHAIDMGISSRQAVTIFVVIGGTSIPGRLLIGRLSDVKGSKYASIIYAFVMIVAMAWLLWASELWMLYVFAVPFGLCFGAVAPLVAILIGDAFKTHHLRHLGIIFGFLEVGWGVGSAFGPILAGHIYDINKDYTLSFIIGIVAIVMTTLLIPFFKKSTIADVRITAPRKEKT